MKNHEELGIEVEISQIWIGIVMTQTGKIKSKKECLEDIIVALTLKLVMLLTEAQHDVDSYP